VKHSEDQDVHAPVGAHLQYLDVGDQLLRPEALAGTLKGEEDAAECRRRRGMGQREEYGQPCRGESPHFVPRAPGAPIRSAPGYGS